MLCYLSVFRQKFSAKTASLTRAVTSKQISARVRPAPPPAPLCPTQIAGRGADSERARRARLGAFPEIVISQKRQFCRDEQRALMPNQPRLFHNLVDNLPITPSSKLWLVSS
jgi:hypothetical protein